MRKKWPVFDKQGAAGFFSAAHIHSVKTAILRRSQVRETTRRDKIGKTLAKKISVRRILVPIDFSKPSLAAIEYASKVATRLGAEVNLIHVFEPQYPLVGMNAMPLYLPDPEAGIRARSHLEITAKRYGIPLRAEHIHVKKGRPFQEICRLARKIDIDLIIIPTRGNTGLKHLALGSTAERVVRHSPCPVLVLRSGPKAGQNGKLPAASITFPKILVPIDFSDCSMKGLAYAKALARQFRSKLILLNSVAIQYWMTNDEYTRYDLPLLTQQSEKVAREQMHNLVQELQKEKLEVTSSVEIGHAGQQICAAAEEKRVDVIVTSTHGATGLKHVLLGSTAEYVVRHATCPVLVVPSHERPALPSTAKTK